MVGITDCPNMTSAVDHGFSKKLINQSINVYFRIIRSHYSRTGISEAIIQGVWYIFQIYQKPLFKESDHFDLYRKNKKIFNSQQMMALRDMYAWRDEIARLEDESYGYVLACCYVFTNT